MSGSLSQAIATLQTSVSNLTTVDQAATALIQGFAAQLKAAVDAASAAGASAEQLAALNDLHSQIDAQTANLAAAVQTNTPAATGPNAVTPPAGPAALPPAATGGAPGTTSPDGFPTTGEAPQPEPAVAGPDGRPTDPPAEHVEPAEGAATTGGAG